MKIARFFAAIFAVLGVVLMLGTAVVCFASKDAAVKLTETPKAAVECSEALARALEEGDLTAAGKRIYGQPDLGAQGVPADPMSALLWDAYLKAFSCEFRGKLYLEGELFARDMTVTALDVSAVTQSVQLRAKTLLEEKVKSATDMDALYDANNNFRADLIEQVLQQAVTDAIAQDARYVTTDVTVKLICQDGQWWAIPDQTLQQALTGGMA